MSDRLSAVCLALLLAAPLCFILDSELLEREVSTAEDGALAMLSREAVERHAVGLRQRHAQDDRVLAAN